jgi:DNA repair protein SbcC/Rad50
MSNRLDFVPDGTKCSGDNRSVDRTVLAAAAELEARDAELEAALGSVDELAARAAHVRERARALDSFLGAVPAQLAGLEREEAEARDLRAEADRALETAERAEEEVARSRRANEDKRAQAERTLAHAREVAADAATRVERLAGQQRRLLDEERAARGEISELVRGAGEAAAAVRALPSVSESGRTQPGEGLPELVAWADRVGAALLVVRSTIGAERERLQREAGELAAAALGEALYGTSISTLRRRLEDASRAS